MVWIRSVSYYSHALGELTCSAAPRRRRSALKRSQQLESPPPSTAQRTGRSSSSSALQSGGSSGYYSSPHAPSEQAQRARCVWGCAGGRRGVNWTLKGLAPFSSVPASSVHCRAEKVVVLPPAAALCPCDCCVPKAAFTREYLAHKAETLHARSLPHATRTSGPVSSALAVGVGAKRPWGSLNWAV